MEKRTHRYIFPLLLCLWLTGTAAGGQREPGPGDRAMERLLIDHRERETVDDGTLVGCPPPFLFDGGPVPTPENYTTFSPGNFEIRVGRQVYRPGPGRVWQPADLFQRRSLLDAMYPQTGIDGARFSCAVGGAGEISAFHAMEDPRESESPEGPNAREGAYHLRMESRGEIWDLALHYTEGTRRRTDFQGSGEGFSLEKATIPVRWRLVAADLTARMGGLGLHVGGGHAWLDPESGAIDPLKEDQFGEDHARFLVGIDYTFENSLYLVLEYFQDQSGKASPEDYSLNDRLAYLAGDKRSMGRDNLFVGAAYPLTEMTSVELYNIINANDPSVMINPWLVWSAGTAMNLSLSAQIPVGSEDASLAETAPAAFGHIQLNF